MKEKFEDFVNEVRMHYGSDQFIPLHEPRFGQREQELVADTISSTFVSTVGAYVTQFEEQIAEVVGIKRAIATVNGTAALHIALKVVGVEAGDLVVTQALTFVATCSAIRYCDAEPAFVDVEESTFGMSPQSLTEFFDDQCEQRNDQCVYKQNGKIVRACVPMHTFGHPLNINAIAVICAANNVALVEDVAEGVGSYRDGKHVGARGLINTLSFNGNKIITTGGGGMLLTNDEELANLAKHLTTTAKIPHAWHYDHDMLGYNYRLPNLNAALGCAQLESLDYFLQSKRELANKYATWCQKQGVNWIKEPDNCRSNYWLMALKLDSIAERDQFLEYTNNNGVMTRPAWTPMHQLKMYNKAPRAGLDITEDLCNRVVNIPSSSLPLIS